MDDTRPSGGAPAPRITDPAPGGCVAPGADARVTVVSNAPGLPHELVLLAGADPGTELARANLDADTAFPSTHALTIPPDPSPGSPTEYLLAVGIRAGAAEQYRHVIPISTRPAGG